MKIYKDFFTGDEMFADTYKMKLVNDVMYEVQGKLVSRTENDIRLAGSNPSAEEAEEGTDVNVQTGIDIVLNHRLEECLAFQQKKFFTQYLKDYMKKVLTRLEEQAPDEIEVFKGNMTKQMKDIMARFNDLQFFTGESMDCNEGMVAMCEYRDIDGVNTPVMMFFKHGLEEEKC